MRNLENSFSIYPYGYEDELAKKHAAHELRGAQRDERHSYLAEKISRPADATARSIGNLAIQSFTGGILHPTFDTEPRRSQIAPKLSRQLGGPLVHQLVSIDHSPIVINAHTILGYAERQAV